jgi:WD40 repeat protein
VHGRAGLRLHSNRVVAAEVLDHRWGLTASMDGKILIFELDSGAVVQELWASDTLLALSVCKGYVFVGLMSGVCEAFSIRNGGRSAFRYIAQRTPIRSLRTFPLAGNQIKVVAGGQDGAIRQFHVRPVHMNMNMNGGEGVWKVPSDRSFDDRLVLLCNTHVDQEVLDSSGERADQGFLLKGHKAPVVALACDETKVVSASEDGTVMVWDAQKGVAAYSIGQHVDGDLVAAVDFNERYLVVDGTRGSVFVFDYAVGRPPRKANGPLSSSSSSGRPSRKGASSSRRGAGGGGPKPGRAAGGPQPRRNDPQQQPQQPPPQFPQAPFPFLGGWNLGHGPTDNVSGSGVGLGNGNGNAHNGAGGDGAAAERAAEPEGPGEDED